MGDKAKLAKARIELEELYLGVPDESVNLTFQDLAEVKNNGISQPEKKKSISMETIPEDKSRKEESPAMKKIPSLDFNRGLQASKTNPPHHDHHYSSYHHYLNKDTTDSHGHHYSNYRHTVESSMAYDDRSRLSMASVMSPFSDRGGRRRPGIPHSNICTICSTYIYIFRHRCLVCGRVYCRNCVNMGMGEMTEGRKCIACLGRRFSQRYIKRAGEMGCCARYPSMVKQQELLWAEKGPRRSGERGRNRSTMMSRSRSPVTPRTPARSQSRSRSPVTPRTPRRAHHANDASPSFVLNSPYSPYSSAHHHFPF